MVADLDGVYLRGGSKIFDVGLNLFRRAERVASALDKQHWLADVFQVFNSQPRGIAGRVKWITEKHESGDVIRKGLLLFTGHHL